MNVVKFKSIQVTIVILTSVCLTVSGMVIIAYAVFVTRSSAIEAAKERALSEARTQAGIVKAEIEVGLDAARTRAQELMAVKQPGNLLSLSREQVNAMMRQVLIENPRYIACALT